MKRILCVVLCVMIVLASLSALASCGKGDGTDDIEFVETPYKGTKLYVYNWGENIADGSDGSVDIVKMFEKKYGIDVIYTTYASNEEMYTLLAGGGVNYDVVIPSDYMIARLISEGLLQKLDFSNIPNYQNIAEEYRSMYYDQGGEGGAAEYSVPYTVGMVGVVYNTKYVDEADVANKSWDLLWNQKYTGKILTINNSRDAFGISMFYLQNMDVNSKNPDDWQKAYDALVAQRPVLKGYYMDEVFDEMEGENAYIGTYYAGDCLTMMDENENLAFYYPEEGTNIFVDAMCIPTCAKNKGAAELFINFMLEKEWAIENSLYIYYASPNKLVREDAEYKKELGEDYYNYLYSYPASYLNEDGTLNTKKVQYYYDLDRDTKDLLATLWDRLKAAN